MFGLRKGSHIASILILAILCGTGCSTLPSSGIDPSGESVFLGSPPSNPFASIGNASSSTTYVPYNYNAAPCNPSPCAPACDNPCAPSLTNATLTPIPEDPAVSLPQGGWVPSASLQASTPPQIGKSSGPKLLPNPLLGESYDNYPGVRRQWDNTGIILRPGRVVAPIGSQVIIAAGVVAPDRYLSMNERVEWSLASGSVGQFVEVEPDTWTDWFLLDFNIPRKIGPFRAVTSTSRNNRNLTQGTQTTTDDMKIKRGETWVTLTSPVEGTSLVTAFAPSVYGWNARARTATIHWVDVDWQFPAPSFAPAGGSQVLKTCLARHSDHRPLSGWRVRYTITGGPEAGFTPDGSKVTEVITNQNGEAIVEITESQAISGTSQIGIEIIRPDTISTGAGGDAIGSGSTTVTWSAPELAVRKTGPYSVGIGATLTYQINVSNPGALPADDVQITDEIPVGAEYVGSNPPAQLMGSSSLQWQIGRLNPGETRSVQVQLRALQSGSLSSCAEATAVGGLTANECVTTNVGSTKLEIRVESPPAARVGDLVQFDIYVTNRSQVTATNLTIADRFDEGLVSKIPNAMDRREITKKLNDIQPGHTNHTKVNFQATKAGRLCHEVTVTDSSGNRTKAQGCVDVSPAEPVDTGASAETTGPAFPDNRTSSGPPDLRPRVQPPQTSRPEIRITKIGPDKATVGEKVDFQIIVQNVSQVELTNLQILDQYDNQLTLQRRTGGDTPTSDRNSVLWKLASLPPLTKKTYRIECKVTGPAGNRTCNRARVTTDQGVEDTSEACLDVIAPASANTATGGLPTQPPGGSMPPGNLAVQVFDNYEAVDVGRFVTYNISVKNKSALSDRNVTLVVEVSPELIPKLIGSIGPNTTKPKIEGQRLTFPSIPTIGAGETLHYRVQVQTGKAGNAKVRAIVSSQAVPQKAEATEQTRVTPGQ